MYDIEASEFTGYDVQQYAQWLYSSGSVYEWYSHLLPVLPAAALGLALQVPQNPEQVFSHINWLIGSIAGLLCAAFTLLFSWKYSPAIDSRRQFIYLNLMQGGILDALRSALAYQRMPRLGATSGRYGARKLSQRFWSDNLLGRLRHLLRSYHYCCWDLKLKPWPGWDAAMAVAILVLMAPGFILLELHPRHSHGLSTYEMSFLLNYPWLWHAALWMMLTGLALVLWLIPGHTASLRFALADALQPDGAAAIEPALPEPDPLPALPYSDSPF